MGEAARAAVAWALQARAAQAQAITKSLETMEKTMPKAKIDGLRGSAS